MPYFSYFPLMFPHFDPQNWRILLYSQLNPWCFVILGPLRAGPIFHRRKRSGLFFGLPTPRINQSINQSANNSANRGQPARRRGQLPWWGRGPLSRGRGQLPQGRGRVARAWETVRELDLVWRGSKTASFREFWPKTPSFPQNM